METFIDEPVRIACLFENGQIKPLVFFWKKRTYKVTGVVFSYSKLVGKDKIYYFSLQCPQGNFELSFNLQKLNWRLEKTYGE